MPELARKIDRGKWLQFDIKNNEDVSADAITICMKTQGNKLSVWEIETDVQIDEAALAIVAGQDRLDTIDVVLFSTDSILSKDIEIDESKGITRVKDLVDTHKDIIQLSYSKLGTIADVIVEQFKLDKIKRYTTSDQKELLKNAIVNGRLMKDDLPEAVRKKLD